MSKIIRMNKSVWDYIPEYDKKNICENCCEMITCRGCVIWRKGVERKRAAEQEEKKEDDDDYTPSATRGDYSPRHPWDAPGMSMKDFF